MDIERTTIKKIECLGEVDDYVYDISIANQDPLFFANDILVHNTDSVYFSAWPIIKDQVESGEMEWSKEICIQLYDKIAESVNASFPEFMVNACHCTPEMGSIIKGGRELVAEKGLFITKKRYAVLITDLEGKRLDKDGKPGKVKAMGMDLKRSDTPKIVQEFLMDILTDLLVGKTKEHLVEKIKEFKIKFTELPPWEKGTPKRVNNLTSYTAKAAASNKAIVPGHVRAAINYNTLRRLYGDKFSPAIVDGMKTIVCKLKDNPMGIKSVGYPTDITKVPDWFRDLPFDQDLMEATIVDRKVENLLGVLNWDISASTDIKSTFESLFEFE